MKKLLILFIPLVFIFGCEKDNPGCMDPNAYNYDASADVDDGSCIVVIEGCTDEIACNYDSLANFDDGSCVFVSNPSVDMTVGSGIWDSYFDHWCTGDWTTVSIGTYNFNSDGTVHKRINVK